MSAPTPYNASGAPGWNRQGATRTTVSTLPDGSRIKTTEMIGPDGSKTVVKETTDPYGVTTVESTRYPVAPTMSYYTDGTQQVVTEELQPEQEFPATAAGPEMGAATGVATVARSEPKPEVFLCPITREMMSDPVIAPNGNTYERSAVSRWLQNSGGVLPGSQMRSSEGQLAPNHRLKAQIEEYMRHGIGPGGRAQGGESQVGATTGPAGRQLMIEAVLGDRSLTEGEKRRRVKEIMTGGAAAGVPETVAAPSPPHFEEISGSHKPATGWSAGKRRATTMQQPHMPDDCQEIGVGAAVGSPPFTQSSAPYDMPPSNMGASGSQQPFLPTPMQQQPPSAQYGRDMASQEEVFRCGQAAPPNAALGTGRRGSRPRPGAGVRPSTHQATGLVEETGVPNTGSKMSGTPQPGTSQPTASEGEARREAGADSSSRWCPNRKRLYIFLGLLVLALGGAAAGIAIALKPKPEPDPATTVTTSMPPVTTSTTPVTREGLLTSIALSVSGDDVFDSTTAQYAALNWLLHDDPMKMDPTSNSEERIAQRYIAALLYFAWGGEVWAQNDGFLGGTSECGWFGIKCESSWITELNFGGGRLGTVGNSAVGPFLDELVYLRHLKNLRLMSNVIYGTLPDNIGDLAALETLGMGGCQLSGSIPDSVTKLVKLKGMHLWDNKLTGRIPDIGNLLRLENLELSNNSLSETIPASLGNLVNLERFMLNDNELTGPIPSSLGNIRNLEILWLRENDLTGAIPTSLGNLVNLEELWLGYNDLTGAIPTSLGNLVNLEELVLMVNRLMGELPDLSKLESLRWLHLWGNLVTGTVPAWLTKLTDLAIVNFGDNILAGQLPEGFDNLMKLEDLNMRKNTFTGPLPVFGMLPKLVDIYIDDNKLTGTISSALADLSSLEDFVVYSNKLSGSLPPSLGNQTKLKALAFFDNELTGTIPSSLGNLKVLEQLHLEYNDFTGSVPASVCSLRSGALEILSADCAGSSPEVQCSCCTECV